MPNAVFAERGPSGETVWRDEEGGEVTGETAMAADIAYGEFVPFKDGPETLEESCRLRGVELSAEQLAEVRRLDAKGEA